MSRPVNQWRQRSRDFWLRLLRRNRAENGPILLDRRRIYVFPNRHGMILALVLLAMLVGAINYNNSLAYALTFLLAGLTVVSILHTFRNLHRLRFHVGHGEACFVGEQAAFPLAVDNRGHPARFAVVVSLPGEAPRRFDVAADDQTWLTLHLPATRRGWMPLPRITVETTFPLGLIRGWGYLHLDAETLVYPRPADGRGLPPHTEQPGEGEGDSGSGVDDFSQLRPYHPGDSLRHIDWKALARERGLLTRQFGGDRSAALWLDWSMLAGRDAEWKLSLLCRWVIEAESAGFRYGLRLPHRALEPSNGRAHRRRCLEALALFGEGS